MNTENTVKKKKGFGGAFIERFGVDALDYEVPAHSNTLLFTLGGITAISLALTGISGIILAMWYIPTPEEANASIRVIMERVYLGDVIRGIHYWSAQLTILSIVVHMLRVFLYGSYKKPREGNWIVGVLLFGVVMGLYFTGTTLKWDQEGSEALGHGEAIANSVGLGSFFDSEYIPALIRLFVVHVGILPVILVALLAIHLLLVKRHKISPLPWKNKQGTAIEHAEAAATVEPSIAVAQYKVVQGHGIKHSFLQHIRSLIGYSYIALGVVIILAIMSPPSIGPDPIAGIEVTKPVLAFLWLYSLEEWIGVNGTAIVAAILYAGLFAIPFFDRRDTLSFSKRKWIISIGGVVLITLIILTIYAIYSQPVVHLDM